MANKRSRRSFGLLKKAFELNRETGLSCMAVIRTHTGNVTYWASPDFEYKLKNNQAVLDSETAVFNDNIGKEETLSVRNKAGDLPEVVEPSPEKMPAALSFITPKRGPSQAAMLRAAHLEKDVSPTEPAPKTPEKRKKSTKARNSAKKQDPNTCARCAKVWNHDDDETWIYCDHCDGSTCEPCSGIKGLKKSQLKNLRFTCVKCFK